jgi:excisionase family DNA binding protein
VVRREAVTISQTDAKLPILEEDQRDILALYQKIQKFRARLVGPDGRTQELPSSLYSFLLKLIGDLNDGKSVSIIQNQAQLTTIEAAKMLGVSRQFLVDLLKRDEIPFHMVGTHRRLYLKDLLAYKNRRDSNRRKILDDLSREESDDGLYDLVPPNADHS